jgi:3'(2'), 5'-bisphosphate nucleotidase
MSDAMVLGRSLEGRDAASTKTDASPVTVADLAIQAIVVSRIGEEFRDDHVIAEEEASLLRTDPILLTRVTEIVRRIVNVADSDQIVNWIDRGAAAAGSRFWALDPIDGTKGFLRGGQYCMALALIVGGRVRLGILGCPRLSLTPDAGTAQIGERSANGGMAIAVRGRGAWWNAAGEETCRRLEVSACRDLSLARVAQSFEREHGDATRSERVLQSMRNTRPPLLLDSQAKHVTIAAGLTDLLMRFPPSADFHDSVWDQAAGTLLIEEAGGRVTDLAGQSLDFAAGRLLSRNAGLLASNGLLHPAALEAIQHAT